MRIGYALLVNVEEVLRVGRIEVFRDARCGLASALKEGVERPVKGGLARTVWTVNEEVTTFEVKGELPERLEIVNLDTVESGLHSAPSYFTTARSSGLSAVMRSRRFRIFDEGAFRERQRSAMNTRCWDTVALAS